MDAKKLQQPSPKIGSENRIAVTDEGLREAVNPDDVVDEQRRYIGCWHGLRCRDEDVLFRQAVDHDEDGVMVLGRGQVGDPL